MWSAQSTVTHSSSGGLLLRQLRLRASIVFRLAAETEQVAVAVALADSAHRLAHGQHRSFQRMALRRSEPVAAITAPVVEVEADTITTRIVVLQLLLRLLHHLLLQLLQQMNPRLRLSSVRLRYGQEWRWRIVCSRV